MRIRLGKEAAIIGRCEGGPARPGAAQNAIRRHAHGGYAGGRSAAAHLLMHELSIATSIIDMAQEEAEKRGVRVLAVHLKLGPIGRA